MTHKLVLIFTLSIFAFTNAYTQNIDKANKKYEAFLFQKKITPSLELMAYTFKIPYPEKVDMDKLKAVIMEKEGVIEFTKGKNQNEHIIYYSSFIDEGTIADLLSHYVKIKYEKISLVKIDI